MSLEAFQSLVNEPIVNSNLKRDFLKVNHQKGAQLNQSNQNMDFVPGEINHYHQIGNAYLEFDVTVRKYDTTNFHYEDLIRLVNNAVAFCFKEVPLISNIGGDIEDNNFRGQVSTIMKVKANKVADFFISI